MHTRNLSFDGLRKTRDHYIPTSRGGTNSKENIRWACSRCNSIKADMMPAEWERFMAANPLWWERRAKVSFASLVEAHRAKHAEFLTGDARYVATYGKRAYRSWVARGRPTPPYDLRPLRPGEPLPIEYPDDPLKQAAFEALYKNHRSMLRVPAMWVPKDWARSAEVI